MSFEIDCLNNQSLRPVDTDAVVALASRCLAAEGITDNAELSISFVAPDEIAQLNEAHLGHVGPTDVLSFAIEDDPRAGAPEPGAPLLLGDLIICPQIAWRNAPEHAGTYEDEIELLVVHGILHLLGRDHEEDAEAEEMEAREQELLRAHRAARR